MEDEEDRYREPRGSGGRRPCAALSVLSAGSPAVCRLRRDAHECAVNGDGTPRALDGPVELEVRLIAREGARAVGGPPSTVAELQSSGELVSGEGHCRLTREFAEQVLNGVAPAIPGSGGPF